MLISENLKTIFKSEGPVFDDVLGQKSIKEQIKSALLMDRHVLIVGPPGIGKTTIAKNIAKILPSAEIKIDGEMKTLSGEERFVRIQGSPDLTVEDILGDIDPVKALKFGPMSVDAFTPGKIFKANHGVLFFDELNRCPEKLQNALLQVLQERKATIGSYDVDFDTDFVLIATMNPEDSSTEKLSDVLLDRFDVVYMDYPDTLAIEQNIVLKHGKKISDVEMPDELVTLAVKFVRGLRNSDKLLKFPSVRATLGLYERAQSNAFLRNKDVVEFVDLMDAVESVISHRIELKPSVKYLEDPLTFVKQEFEKFMNKNQIKLPKLDDGKDGGCP
ncbi:MoxR family ATPase [Candidatus Woesearchaeota archaeon]|jgi:magnesium chelatase subunit I|nr:MoxR family ATPase [Candidatus Woesearchaeota archaeon]MBT3538154.1 MoxR family ATPase [Candidatus Woesearchaeota archaeon]MBT4697487.1 MoxR family ATPase [Candidatus Woesearchaeota archaeon]MBT4716869.1 MoxR family ATPase [Candidatus Woesearchaeota archaeon]MBT7105823.1 MoxR family ATPase [Candidatus Woesearchaeota archaeon]